MPAGEKLKPVSPAQAADIPSVDRLLRAAPLQELLARHGRTAVTTILRACLAQLRRAALAGELAPDGLEESAIAAAVGAQLARALLPAEAVDAVARAMSNPVNLEFDLAVGRRGERDSLIERTLCELTGA